MEIIRSIYSLDLELREAKKGEKYHRVEGQAVPFDSRTRIFGRYYEQFSKGAFVRTLGEDDPDAALLIDHRGLAIARQSNKTVRFKEDSEGLQFDAKLDRDDPDVQALVPKLRSGNTRHMSVGFLPREWSTRYEDDDTVTDVMMDVDLYEASFVTFPAYSDTEATMRTRSMLRENGKGKGQGDRVDSFIERMRNAENNLKVFRMSHLS